MARQVQAQKTADTICPLPAPGSQVLEPPEIRSQSGRLELTLRFEISEDPHGRILFCYLTDTGLQAPTLRLNRGDELIIHLRNELQASPARQPRNSAMHHSMDCADGAVTLGATNLHFHGLNIPPKCHQDDVMRTLIEQGTNFDYRVKIPENASPGLYWYHPHPHPFGAAQVKGGASGALIVEGIAGIFPEVRGLRERVLVLRDQKITKDISRVTDPNLPAFDVSLNDVPVLYPDYVPAMIQAAPQQEEFWRVVNASADTIFDLQVIMNQAPQQLRLLGIDGVPIHISRDSGHLSRPTDVLLPPGARAEFVVRTAKLHDRAQLVTRAWDTGVGGDKTPARPLATLLSTDVQPGHMRRTLAQLTTKDDLRSLKTKAPAISRTLYFSQNTADPKFGATSYYLTVAGQTSARFAMDAPPNIIVHRGAVEDWTIENRSREEHVFHIHQIHFQVIEINGKPANDPALRDTIDVPYWKGEGPYPSIKLRMDFSDPNVSGTLMYHCHILEHSANGMMGTVQVLGPSEALVSK